MNNYFSHIYEPIHLYECILPLLLQPKMFALTCSFKKELDSLEFIKFVDWDDEDEIQLSLKGLWFMHVMGKELNKHNYV